MASCDGASNVCQALWGGESDDDYEHEGMLTDDDNETSPIANVDPFISFAQLIQTTHSADEARFRALTGVGPGRICSRR